MPKLYLCVVCEWESEWVRNESEWNEGQFRITYEWHFENVSRRVLLKFASHKLPQVFPEIYQTSLQWLEVIRSQCILGWCSSVVPNEQHQWNSQCWDDWVFSTSWVPIRWHSTCFHQFYPNSPLQHNGILSFKTKVKSDKIVFEENFNRKIDFNFPIINVIRKREKGEDFQAESGQLLSKAYLLIATVSPVSKFNPL